MKRVVVVGGGIIGLSAAFSLQRRGAEVTIVESHAGSHGASVVNAGWICPSLSDPVPSPGLIKTSLNWMRHADSPLYIKPSLNYDFLRWLISFWRHCNDRSFTHALQVTSALNKRTFDLYGQMVAAGVKFEHHQSGILFVFHSREKLEVDLKAIEFFAQYGINPSKPLWGEDLRQLEPSLSPAISGGFWYEGERHVRPDTLTSGLAHWLAEHDVTIRTQTQVIDFECVNGQVNAISTTGGRIEADAVLIAAGTWSGTLAKKVGVHIPIQGGKGYCLDYEPAPVPVNRPIDFAEARFACTPMDGMIRLAGTMELSGINDTIRKERVSAIARAAAQGFAGWPRDIHRARIGNGLRPMTPDGLPVIGFLPGFRNLAVASGHAMLGVTLAASTGDEIAETIMTGRATELIKPFDPARFN
jgi:D-amino-acid dehydrogenase